MTDNYSVSEGIKFDSYEISPYKQVDNGASNHLDVEVCMIEEAEFWGLYGARNIVDKDDNGAWLTEARHLFDRPTKEECKQVLFEIFKTKEYKLIHE